MGFQAEVDLYDSAVTLDFFHKKNMLGGHNVKYPHGRKCTT